MLVLKHPRIAIRKRQLLVIVFTSIDSLPSATRTGSHERLLSASQWLTVGHRARVSMSLIWEYSSHVRQDVSLGASQQQPV